MSPKHVASCSFGKDSIATILLALEHGEPLDEAVYCEVMFDDATSGEVPEHQALSIRQRFPPLKNWAYLSVCFGAGKTTPLFLWGRSRAGRSKV